MERWLRERELDILAHIEDEYRSKTGVFEMVKITKYDSNYDESSPDIPVGYGIEQHPRDGWYAYRLPEYPGLCQVYLKDEQGLDRVFSSREDALAALKQGAN